MVLDFGNAARALTIPPWYVPRLFAGPTADTSSVQERRDAVPHLGRSLGRPVHGVRNGLSEPYRP